MKPSMLAQYEATSHEFFATLAQAKVDPATFSIIGFMSPDFRYTYFAPISDFAGMDKINQVFMTMADKVGKDKWADVMRRSGAATESYADFIIMERPDLSYVPAAPRVKAEDRKFYRVQFYYLMPGHETDAEAIAHDYAALFKQKNIPDGFTIYTAVTGNDLPLLVASVGAKSMADFAAADERNNATLGDAVRPLQGRALAITRRFEVRDYTTRPDLVYPMPAASNK
jgi:hypothetical protein